MLHGWGDDLRTFTDLQIALGKNNRAVSLDLPGFGQTQIPPVAWGLEDYAKFIQAFLDKLKIKQVYAVVAHSNGAALAIYAAAHGQLTPDKLILLGAAGIRNKYKGRRRVIKVIAKSGKLATLWLPERHRKTLRKKLYGVSGSDMLVVPQLQETFKKTVAQDVQVEAAEILEPVLLIYGEKDRATPPLFGEIYHNLMNGSMLEIIGDAGHFVHLDQPRKVTQLIEEFLD
jgi:pimeloyl-ACP methyl ester carboxylesterase